MPSKREQEEREEEERQTRDLLSDLQVLLSQPRKLTSILIDAGSESNARDQLRQTFDVSVEAARTILDNQLKLLIQENLDQARAHFETGAWKRQDHDVD